MNGFSSAPLNLSQLPPANHLGADEAGSSYTVQDPSIPAHWLEVRKLNEQAAANMAASGLGVALEALLADPADSPFPVVDFQWDSGSAYVARRYLGGPTVLELLKSRQALSMPEVAIILSQIGPALEAISALSPAQPVITSLDQIRVRPTSPGQEVTRVNPGAVLDVDLVRVMLNSWERRSQLPLTIHLAEIACWLTGHPQGTRLGERVPRYSPGPELSMEQNQVIKSVFEERDPAALPSPLDFVTKLTGQTPPPAPLAFRFSKQEEKLNLVEDWETAWGDGGARFRLLPVGVPGEPPIITVTGESHFTLGRSSACDYVAQFRPRNLANDSRTRQISRQQLRIEDGPDGVHLRHLGSQENTAVNGMPVASVVKLACPGQSRVTVAEEYQAEVTLFASAFPKPPDVEGLGPLESPGRNCGGGFARPLLENAQTLAARVWWVARDLSLTVDERGELRPTSPQESWGVVARLHWFLNRIWIERRGHVAVSLGDTALAVHQLAPLAADQVLQIGNHTFHLQPFPEAAEEAS